MRRFLAALTVLLISTLACLTGAEAASCPAESFVRNAGQAYDRAAAAGSPSAFASAAARYSDLRALSLFALGKYRNDLPKSREAEYLSLTRRFIGETLKEYGQGLSGGIADILDCDSAGGVLTVTARSASGKKIVFRLAKAGGGYTVKDVNMQGIWLAQQMRSKFTATISRKGIDGLFAYLGS
ncbi:MAG: ABC transporter substrate-binding protein [Aestuariivirga sp.]|uniref:ABC transporter substrate-binding protein n=1 Tax=Aestuariivirga sp. TaxID=2650926 RepID=UPI0025B82C90|nr:ABC transporter substrate-binding protein [Aestuariivirga sp.]MCA3560443.1 ABC transporter substrate-binding protein [Aestuariivirga sp.]